MTTRHTYPRRISHQHVDGVLEAISADGDTALFLAHDLHAHHRQPGREVAYLTLDGADSHVTFHATRPLGDWRRTEGAD